VRIAVALTVLFALSAVITGCSGAARKLSDRTTSKSSGSSSTTTAETQFVISAGAQSPLDTTPPPALPEAPVAPGLLLAISATLVLGAGTLIVLKQQRRDSRE
jgi:hypothetical protein